MVDQKKRGLSFCHPKDSPEAVLSLLSSTLWTPEYANGKKKNPCSHVFIIFLVSLDNKKLEGVYKYYFELFLQCISG